MATLEMVEKLKEKANVTYDEARAALEACNDDLLDAIIYLERQGKVDKTTHTASYSTKAEKVEEPVKASAKKETPRGETFSQLMNRFFSWCGRVIHKGNINTFEVWKDNKAILTLPVTVLVLLLIFCFWVTLPAMVIGLFCGLRYQFRGEDLGKPAVNNVMSSASKTVDQIKSELEDLEIKKGK